MGENTRHPNWIVEMVTKYWPNCPRRPFLVALAGPGSTLRELLVDNMKRNGAMEYELCMVHEYYRNMDACFRDAFETQ